jgi:hypothetical protein
MSGSGPWKPNATRVIRRILVFVESTSAFDLPWLRVAWMGRQVRADLLGERDEVRDPAARGPGEPLVDGVLDLLAADLERRTVGVP